MRTIRFTIILFVLSLTHSIQAQNRRKTPQKLKSQTVKLNKQKGKLQGKIISLCVINGKAVNLVKPQYPAAAKLVNIKGSVNVSVLIDEEGNVIEAKAVSGHPLLKANSVSAALQSKFAPAILSNKPVKVRGIIVYKYISDVFNWLEIGNDAENASFVEMLPAGFDEEKQLYEQYNSAGDKNRTLILQNIRASVENKLIDKRKDFWFFQVGRLLNKFQDNCCESEENTAKLKMLLLNFPEHISPVLIAKLRAMVSVLENPQLNTYNPQNGSRIYRQLREINEKLPMLGN